MKAAKSEGGLSRGRMRYCASGHKCWVQTLNYFSNVNRRVEEGVTKDDPLHSDLVETQMKRDAEAVKWFDENNPFDHDRDKQLLVSSQQDSQALQMMQSTLKERLKFMKLGGKCR